jgi:putative membrane protein
MVTLSLADADKRRIAAAVAVIETHSAAEILVVTSPAAADYADVVALAAAGLALCGGALAALLWPLPALTVVAGQMALFTLVWGGLTWAGLGHRLVPRALRTARAERAAALEFARLVNAQTADKRGLLIYLSFAERHIEIVADRGIAAAVPDARWQEIIDAFPAALRDRSFGEALFEVVGRCGEILVAAFPAEAGQRNEMADHVVER